MYAYKQVWAHSSDPWNLSMQFSKWHIFLHYFWHDHVTQIIMVHIVHNYNCNVYPIFKEFQHSQTFINSFTWQIYYLSWSRYWVLQWGMSTGVQQIIHWYLLLMIFRAGKNPNFPASQSLFPAKKSHEVFFLLAPDMIQYRKRCFDRHLYCVKLWHHWKNPK